LAVDFPGKQAAPRLELTDVARGRVAAQAELARLEPLLTGGEAEISERHADVGSGVVAKSRQLALVVVIERQVARRLVELLGVASDKAPLENRSDVAIVLAVEDPFRETQSGSAVLVPLLARLIFGFRGYQRRFLGQIPDLVIGLGRCGVFEERRLLAVGVAAA